MYAKLLSSEHASFEDQASARAATHTHTHTHTVVAKAFLTTDTLAPTHSPVNCFIDPIEDGIEPLNWLSLSNLQDTETASRWCEWGASVLCVCVCVCVCVYVAARALTWSSKEACSELSNLAYSN